MLTPGTAIVAKPAEIPVDAMTMVLSSAGLLSLGSILGTFSYLTSTSYTFTDAQRGNFINMNPSGTCAITLPELSTITTPVMYLIRRAATTTAITLTAAGTNLFAAGAHSGTTTSTYAIPTTVGTVVLIYGVTSGSYANKWIPVQLV